MSRLVQITRVAREEYCTEVAGLIERDTGIEPQIPVRRFSKYYSERLITPDDVPVPDCVECGACCVHALIVPIGREESERLETCVEIVLDEVDDVAVGRVLPRSAETGYCAHLGGTTGIKVGCTIYEERPFVCRDFDPGSDRCHAYRRVHGLEPPLDDETVAIALERIEARPNSWRIPGVQIELKSRKVGVDFSDGESKLIETIAVTATARMDDGTEHELHTYDPRVEEWYEHELEGVTLEEARELIESRKQGSNDLNV